MSAAETFELRHYAEPRTYVERLGVGVDEVLEKLAAPPERPLTSEERDTFFAIDAELLKGRYDRDLGEGIEGTAGDVEGWYREPDAPINFVLDYFTTDEGEADLARFEEDHGLAPEATAAHAGVQQAQRLAALGRHVQDNDGLTKELKKLAARSHKHAVDRVMAEHDGDLEDSTHVYVFTQPERTLEQVRQVQRMRSFLRGVRGDIMRRSDVSDNVRAALLTSVDGLRQKATAQLGGLYPNVIGLYHQAILLRDSDPSYTDSVINELADLRTPILPLLEAIEQDDDVEERFMFTMDRWRNGVVANTENTSFSDELLELEESLDARTNEEEEFLDSIFTPEETAYLDSLEFNADSMADMARYWLGRNGLLSEDAEDLFEKGSWPSDSQEGSPRVGVVVGQFDNLQYSRGWILIPAKAKRKLRQVAPSGPAFVIPHEEQHAIDGITAQYGERQVSVSAVSARNSTGVREGVGKEEEDRASRQLFGEPLHQSTAYSKALRAWGETGSESAAIVAFANQAAREQGLEEPTRKIWENAENRVQRLIKAGVQAAQGWNSQPLVYVEQVLVANALEKVPKEVRDMVAANSYLDLDLMARYHEFGLLATERFQPEVTPIQAMEEYLRHMLNERVAA